MLPHPDPVIAAEHWSFETLKRRPWRPGNDAVLCEYLLAMAIRDDLEAVEEAEEVRRLRWWDLAGEVFDLTWRGVACFFALTGFLITFRYTPAEATFLAALLTLGGVLFELWTRLNDHRWAGELEELATIKSCDVARFGEGA